MPSPNLRDLLVQLAQTLTDQPDVPAALIHALHEAGESAVRDEAINIGGDQITAAGSSVVINRADHAQVIINRPDAATLVSAILQVRQQVADEQAGESRRRINEYLVAVRNYCANLPYLTLNDIRPPRTLHEVYVPLMARAQPGKDINKGMDEQVQIREALHAKPVSIAEIFRNREQRNILILGEPGSGKSTLLRQLAECAYEAPKKAGLGTPHIPALVPLRRLATTGGSLENRLNRALADELMLTEYLPAGFFNDWPTQTGARWLILLDALDEVPVDERLRLVRWLRDLLEKTIDQQHLVVITSRPSGYMAEALDDSKLAQYNLLPFTMEQASEFAHKWFDNRAKHFLEELDRVHAGDLCGTPLLLTIAAKVYFEQGALPERRSALYGQFVLILP